MNDYMYDYMKGVTDSVWEFASHKSTAEEVSFEWPHHRVLSTDSKVRTTLHVSIIDLTGSEMVKDLSGNRI